MSKNYQAESDHIAEYNLWQHPKVNFPLRGPAMALNGTAPMISFLGAAQVFGAFVNAPFPNLLGEMLSARVLNLGNGGAGPGLYLAEPGLIELVNETALCVIQIMSARSSMENKYMRSVNGRASVKFTHPDGRQEECMGHHALRAIARELPAEEFRALIAETQANFLAQYQALCAAITVPKVLVYVGRNPPIVDAEAAQWAPEQWIGTHPHLITESLYAELGKLGDACLCIADDAGADQPLLDRHTGTTTSIKRSETLTITNHRAYISPHMHARTALELFPVVGSYLPR